ncbi:MAG: phosphoribosylformylglycinamidine synthase subunit PurQ [Firmicutes bacterium]|nr:phosphoribosylformylglycinamidine synthase subunit PurQ [Bacillota bacterium]
MKFGVVVFPGSNCDMDCYHVIDQVLGHPVSYIWHQEKSLSGFDCIILPGGFSYGDYLRTGAIARFSPVMEAVADFAERGGLVLGICNGFQILLEAGLLPGAMRRNDSLQFRCQDAYLRVENAETPFTNRYRPGEVIRMPIAHGEGNYYADPETAAALEREGQVVFRYCTPAGEIAPQANPNGSLGNIAGICNRGRNVLGLMPHPERCSEEILGYADGRRLFLSVLAWWGLERERGVVACG